MTYRFFPPSVDEPPPTVEDRISQMFTWPQGISLVLSDGLYVEHRGFALVEGWVEGVDYFVGGYRYSGVSDQIAQVLIASGYGHLLEEETTT